MYLFIHLFFSNIFEIKIIRIALFLNSHKEHYCNCTIGRTLRLHNSVKYPREGKLQIHLGFVLIYSAICVKNIDFVSSKYRKFDWISFPPENLVTFIWHVCFCTYKQQNWKYLIVSFKMRHFVYLYQLKYLTVTVSFSDKI